jgi:hypothetical protein
MSKWMRWTEHVEGMGEITDVIEYYIMEKRSFEICLSSRF